MKTRQLTFVLFAAALALALCACSKTDANPTDDREDTASVSQIDEDDPEMAAAIQKAQETLDTFIEALEDPRRRDYSLIARFRSADGGFEHLWVDGIEYKDGTFRGKLADSPENLKSKRAGDPVEFDRKDVSDWVILEDGKLLGGYTAKVLAVRESKK